jgi:hypothetical protein
MTVPNTTDILGVEPRYHLRSGFAGLQINEANKINVSVQQFVPEVVVRALVFRSLHQTQQPKLTTGRWTNLTSVNY